tara:strand:+ start:750 stop:1199 length:450 start_codon:yes stop_codon:yes gene_type:complete
MNMKLIYSIFFFGIFLLDANAQSTLKIPMNHDIQRGDILLVSDLLISSDPYLNLPSITVLAVELEVEKLDGQASAIIINGGLSGELVEIKEGLTELILPIHSIIKNSFVQDLEVEISGQVKIKSIQIRIKDKDKSPPDNGGFGGVKPPQ